MRFSVTVSVVAALVAGVSAWGADGHRTVGCFLTPKTLSFVQTSLGTAFNRSLGTAATWADDVKNQAAFTWSKNLHFVDAEDSPTTNSCSVHELRDCGNGVCVLAAIANYTTRLVTPSLGTEQVSEALRFLDHFIGDLSQPLHVEAIEAGGNGITVTCQGRSTNLHAIWDTNMLDVHLNTSFGGSIATYTNNLVARIKADNFSVPVSNWLSCTSTTEPFTVVDPNPNGKRDDDFGADIRRDIRGLLGLGHGLDKRAITPLACPLVWARESNLFDCATVFPVRTGDLCTGTYLANAIPVIDIQIARSGLRLATWLNELLDP
ncbi:nuclease Le1 [Exidia glandulosa HHB12029]|uniref:Nuclease Le1 n=1 Tax=Exidia glandulosa HHB12029 TaxID=1314781 RepID=A0A165Q977_EXIGL|nr:nuclease Le1 [Exidia glandulosa HHB12029]